MKKVKTKLTIPYFAWRFLYWGKNKKLTYEQIDKMVEKGKIIPSDNQVK